MNAGKSLKARVASAVLALILLGASSTPLYADQSYILPSDTPSESGGVGRTGKIDIGCIYISPNEVLHTDYFGATAYGWELEEGIRLIMLEAGGESEADIREHCAVLFKQLRYTQTVGGYDDWGTTLYGVIHGSRTYVQTAPRIWNPEAEPTDFVRDIFWDVWLNGYDTDIRVQTYRDSHFAEWAIPAYQIGNTFYSINPWQDFSAFDN